MSAQPLESDDAAPRHPRHDLHDVIHQPVRLSIMAFLAYSARVDFAFIRNQLAVGESNLSQHLGALENLGYLSIEKVFENKRARTWLSLTPAGRVAFDEHVQALRRIVDGPPATTPETTGERAIREISHHSMPQED